jgi:hypothetical protein
MKRIAAILAWMMLVGVGSAIGAGATGPVYMDSTLKQPIGIRSIKLNGSTSGSTVISAPAVASNCSAGQVLGFSDGAGTLQCAASSGGTLSGVNGIDFILTSTTTITATGTGTGTGTATGTATSAATFTRSGTATTTTSASDTLTATGMNGLGTITISSSATSTTVRTATFVGGVNWGHNPTNTASATSTTPVTVTATVTPTVTATITGAGSSTSGITGTVSGTATGSGTGTNTAAEGGTTTMVATATTTYNNSQTKTLTGTWAQSVTQSGTGTISILVTSTATTTFTASSIQTVTCVGTGTGTTTVTGAVTASATGTGTGVMTGTEYQTATSATLPTTISYNYKLNIVPGGDRFFAHDYDASLSIWGGFKAAPYSDPSADNENRRQAFPTVGAPYVFNESNTTDFRALDLESIDLGPSSFSSPAEWIPEGEIKLWLWAKATSPAAITVEFRRCNKFTPVDVVATIGPLSVTSTIMSMQYATVDIPEGGILLIPNVQLCIRFTATTTSGTPTVTIGSSSGYHTRINGPWVKVGTTIH